MIEIDTENHRLSLEPHCSLHYRDGDLTLSFHLEGRCRLCGLRFRTLKVGLLDPWTLRQLREDISFSADATNCHSPGGPE